MHNIDLYIFILYIFLMRFFSSWILRTYDVHVPSSTEAAAVRMLINLIYNTYDF